MDAWLAMDVGSSNVSDSDFPKPIHVVSIRGIWIHLLFYFSPVPPILNVVSMMS